MFCAHCGKELPANAVFCAHCGKKCDIKIELKYSNSGPKQSVAANVSSSFLSDEDKKTLKKIAIIAIPLIAFLIIAVILFLFVSTPKDKNEADLVKDLSSHSNFYPSQDLTITDLSIIKRQTDIDKKMDVIYVDVQAQNESIECRLSYVLEYHLYNDGWRLDLVTPYNSNSWKIYPLKGPTLSEAEKAMRNTGGVYAYLRDDLDSVNGVCTYYYSVSSKFRYAEKKSTIEIIFRFDEKNTSWSVDSVKEVDVSATWDLEGDWYPAQEMWYGRYYMKITNVNDTSFNVVVFNSSTDEIYYEGEISLTPAGADFDAEVSAWSWDTLDFFITADKVYVKGRGTRSDCEYIRN